MEILLRNLNAALQTVWANLATLKYFYIAAPEKFTESICDIGLFVCSTRHLNKFMYYFFWSIKKYIWYKKA
jgi:hypothetical protein